MGVPPGNRPAVPRDWYRGVPERYVAGADTRGRPEGRLYPWSQQVIHEISGLELPHHRIIIQVVGDRPAYTIYFLQVVRKELNLPPLWRCPKLDRLCGPLQWRRSAAEQ